MSLKKFFSGVIALFLFLCIAASLPSFAYQTTTYNLSADRTTLFRNDTGAYLLSWSGSEAHIEKLIPDAYGANLRLNHPIASAGVFGDNVVLLSNDVANHQLEVYTYRAETDVLDSFTVNDVRYYTDRGFYYDGSSIYLVSDRSTNTIERYAVSGKKTDSYSFESDIIQLSADYRGNIFAVCADTLYLMNGNRFAACASGIAAPILWFDDSHFSDASGRISTYSGGICRTLFCADAEYGRHHACSTDGVVYYPCGETIYGYDPDTGKKTASFSAGVRINDLFAHNGCIYALSDSGTPVVLTIRADEFTELIYPDDPIPDPVNRPDNVIERDYRITSDVYRIDNNNYTISGIPSGTTPAQFKRNIRCDGYDLSIFRGGSRKTSGECGTAMTAVFDSDRYRFIYELSVIGDITGEGNVNSRDLNCLTEYLIGSVRFDGVYLTSADLSGDGVVDVKDLALMHRMI